VEGHIAACAACGEELQALAATRALLMSAPEEEPPRRIAFVSDKIFEPRWWRRLWASGPRLGFASAAMLSVAIAVHALVPQTSPRTSEIPSALIEAEVARRVQAEVARAVAASEQHQMAKTMEILNTRIRESKSDQRELLLRIADYIERIEKRNSIIVRQALYQ
jgi:hypothetical protein